MAHWTEKHTKKDIVEHYEYEIARLQAEVERLKELNLTLTLKRHTSAMQSCETKRKYEDQAHDDYMALVGQLNTAWNDAIEAAAKWCEENGMAINLKHQGPYSGYVSHPVKGTYGMRHEGKGYASAIRALKRP